jgi:hypothetical protein
MKKLSVEKMEKIEGGVNFFVATTVINCVISPACIMIATLAVVAVAATSTALN